MSIRPRCHGEFFMDSKKNILIHNLMRDAIRLAGDGLQRVSPNPRTGAIILRGDKVIGRGRHACCGGLHAEVEAIRDAGGDVRGCEMIVTLEPCCHTGRTAPCTDLIIRHGISKVYIGMEDPNPLVAGKGIKQLRQVGIEVVTDILRDECAELNQPFIKMMTLGFPYMIAKTAITLDGYIADINKRSKWISSAESRREAHRMRAQYDAVMVGMGTVIADDPQLNVRDVPGDDPVRVVFDPAGSLPEQSKLVKSAGTTPLYVITGEKISAKWKKALEANDVQMICEKGDPETVLVRGLRRLGREGIQSVLIEGGGKLQSMLAAGDNIDRVELFIAPKLLGDGIPMMKIPFRFMPDPAEFVSHAWIPHGPDMRFTGIIKKY